MKRLLFIVLCVWSFSGMASHIVGGEFELIYQGSSSNPYLYRLNLIMYFDEVKGFPENKEQDAVIYVQIFRASDNVLVRDSVRLPFSQEKLVQYTLPECSVLTAELKTSRQFYTTLIVLSPAIYSDPAGYYIAWQRCCRNYQITNIISEEPEPQTDDPNAAGQTFYLAFPPVTKNGAQFINSSPRLFPPLSDFACPNRAYYADFAGTDDDGDSLAYSIVTPFDTHTHFSYPATNKGAPYPLVRWVTPFGPGNIIAGNPDISIDSDGMLRLTPTRQGLFVFAVKCEEFRAGVKIGEVRRDFQLYVVDRCTQSDPPSIVGKKLSEPTLYSSTMSISFSNTESDENRCIQVKVSDPDSELADHEFQEDIKIKAIPIGFKQDVSEILPMDTIAVLFDGDTATFDICFAACPLKEGPFQIGIVAMDNACSLPLTDTLKITVEIEPPPPNLPPYFLTPDTVAAINEGDTLKFTIRARDDDSHPMVLGFVPIDFNAKTAGMTFTPSPQAGDAINASFTWNTSCGGLTFTDMQQFEMWVIVEDMDVCALDNRDSIKLITTIDLYDNTKPLLDIVSLNTAQPLSAGNLSAILGDPIHLGIFGSDTDLIPEQDSLIINLIAVEGTVPPQGYEFAPGQGRGNAATSFLWEPECSIFLPGSAESIFTFTFSVRDMRCNNALSDTVEVTMTVQDVVSDDTVFEPPNIITPNGDNCNDYFAMEGIDPDGKDCGVFTPANLPQDNCRRRFESVHIFNRWGKQVFESFRRDFRWYAFNEPSGVYYYLLKYSDKEYKGTLSVKY